MTVISFKQDRFIATCSFKDRTLPKSAGFRWDDLNKTWYTKDLLVAAKLREYADSNVKEKLNHLLITVTPWSLPLPKPPPGLELKDYQIDSVKFALERNRCYLGLDPGLGKTAVAATVARTLGYKTVYITPPFLVRNVEDEFSRWAPKLKLNSDYIIVPDSMITKDVMLKLISSFVHRTFKNLLIVDEAHRFKNDDAKRSAALYNQIVPGFKKIIFMSGTPMPNRPIELFPVLSKLAPETIDFKNKFHYGFRYCNAQKTVHGWDFSGASNVGELASKVIYPSGPFMLRLKKSVLKLPPKIEEIFLVSEDKSPMLAKLDSTIGKAYSKIEDVMKVKLGGEDLHLASYRRLLGSEKVKPTVEYIKSLLNETNESIIVFAYHKDVIEALHRELGFPPLITGSVPVEKRQEIVKEFQNSAQRVIIGNYLAMGIGFTLTKATRVIFIEFSWVPGENDQASDRPHRIGQENTVLVQYVVFKDTIDKAVVETLLRKRRSTKHI